MDTDLLAFTDLLLDPQGGESQSGIMVQRVYDMLNLVTKDLIEHVIDPLYHDPGLRLSTLGIKFGNQGPNDVLLV